MKIKYFLLHRVLNLNLFTALGGSATIPEWYCNSPRPVYVSSLNTAMTRAPTLNLNGHVVTNATNFPARQIVGVDFLEFLISVLI